MGRKLKKSLLDGEKNEKKFCADCETTKTPLWRSGPAGPKSLCNACGIKFGKQRRSIVGLEKSHRNKKKERSNSMTTTTSSGNKSSNATVGSGNGLSESLKKKLMVLGKEMMLQTSSIVKKQRCQRRRKLGEEEQAAFSLIAMSCGSVLAWKKK